jgi:hypothetical protein
MDHMLTFLGVKDGGIFLQPLLPKEILNAMGLKLLLKITQK